MAHVGTEDTLGGTSAVTLGGGGKTDQAGLEARLPYPVPLCAILRLHLSLPVLGGPGRAEPGGHA